MCGGGGRVEDNSDKVAQIEAQRAADERAAAAAEDNRRRAEFGVKLNSAYQTAIADATRYFQSMGLDPAQYQGAIEQMANSKKSAIPELDSSPGTYFGSLGKDVYTQEEEAARARALREVDRFGGQGFDRRLITDESDDNFINALLEENFGKSSTAIDNQRKRGVLTESGYNEALKELTRQKGGARSNLDAIGTSILETGRGTIRNKVSDARSGAGSLRLGSSFDPSVYEKGVNSDVANFFSGFGDKLRGAAPDDLFDVSRAFSKGGLAQGAQNTAYDPDASSGIFTLFDEEEEKKKKKPGESSPLSPF